MKRILIGHRGVGKTSLLLRHQTYFSQILHFDLDLLIEKKTKMSIVDFFNENGEDRFRQLEFEVYSEIIEKNKKYVISVGAGFQISLIKPDNEVFFVSRQTDADGRLFLDRPRLNLEVSALDESKQRYHQRHLNFRNRADLIYHLSEGIEHPNAIEEKIFKGDFNIEQAYYTLNAKEHSQVSQRINRFSKIELRTDLLSEQQILQIVTKFPQHHWLVSYRTSHLFQVPEHVHTDCDVQFLKGQNYKGKIVSTHSVPIDQALLEVQPYQNQFSIKLCPFINTFAELKKGHEWQQQNPEQRSFLPRSENGKWNWYRQFSKYTQKINFVRNFNEQLDQPSVYQWLNLPDHRPTQWAAVLGQPIYFSRSPVQHENYFKQKNSFMVAIDINSDEFSENLMWLNQLGLTYIAVTAPHKEIAYQHAQQRTPEAQELESANTLFIQLKEIKAHNTDLAGFKVMISGGATEAPIAIWGGGGTLAMMKKVLPQAICFSSQTGSSRDQQPFKNDFKTMIWAAPRRAQTLFPPLEWPVEKIVDLNYVENSVGLEYAQKLISKNNSIQYISGLIMFREQARKQQEFWSTT
jgi:shikimate 5-dehydrogenase/shikimate kinase